MRNIAVIAIIIASLIGIARVVIAEQAVRAIQAHVQVQDSPNPYCVMSSC